MKIQEVIDEVNKAWGEEHEEKRKKIFRDSVLVNPLLKFIGVTLIYLSGIIIYSFKSFLAGTSAEAELVQGWGYVFNVPYFLFDIRASMILSLASVLLSLYVSVGKFADAVEGPSGDARRATYRKFALFTSRFIFVIFVLNFWHGLLSGYFQGTSYAPEIFGPWKYGPEWGKLIITPDMNLRRYNEIPLWILLFFAWFTLSSASFLTYNEKDILIRNAYLFGRSNHIYSNKSLVLEYRLARDLVDSVQAPGQPPYKLGYKYSGLDKYDGKLAYDPNYFGFKFYVKISAYLKDCKVLVILCIWTVAMIVFIVWSVAYTQNSKMILVSLVAFTPISVFEFFNALFDGNHLNKSIYREAARNMGWGKIALDYMKSFWVDGIAKFIGRAILAIFSIVGFVIFVSRAIQAGIPENPINSRELVYALWIFLFVSFIYLLAFFLRVAARRIYTEKLNEHSTKFISAQFPYYSDLENVKHLIVAYIYCSMLRINGYYSIYKSEIGVVEAESKGQELSGCESEIKEKPENHKLWWNYLRVKGRK